MTAYVLAPFWLISLQTVVSLLAPVVLGAYAIWVSGAFRADRGAVAVAANVRPTGASGTVSPSAP